MALTTLSWSGGSGAGDHNFRESLSAVLKDRFDASALRLIA
jgi:hypothetical protein